MPGSTPILQQLFKESTDHCSNYEQQRSLIKANTLWILVDQVPILATFSDLWNPGWINSDPVPRSEISQSKTLIR